MNIKNWFKSKRIAQFFAEEAETQVSFEKSKGIIVGNQYYDYLFETKEVESSVSAARAIAFADGEVRAVTLWQDSNFPELSAYYALRHALENLGRNSLPPKLGDAVRFVIEGQDKLAVVAGGSRYSDDGILIAETEVPPFLDGGKMMFRQATLRAFPAKRFKRTAFYDEIKVWRQADELSSKPAVFFKLLKPTWFIC